MDYLSRAKELAPVLVENRRCLHRHPEIGMDTDYAARYVTARLMEMGYEPYRVGGTGVCATVGKPGKTILLRADMDALPIDEESGLPFASEIPGAAHCCGHDLHTAMLLGAARLLKENEDHLEGTVKLMFQPAEETLEGARAMIDDGLLENPHVDAALGIHVNSKVPAGAILVFHGPTAASQDQFTITVEGKGCHGGRPNEGVDPISIICHIHTALQELQARELAAGEIGVVTVGTISAGTAPNAIPSSATMSGSVRTFDAGVQDMLKERIAQIADGVATAFRGVVTTEFSPRYAIPLVSDEAVSTEVRDALLKIFPEKQVRYIAKSFPGSEDFSFVAERVPTVFTVLGASIGPDAEFGQHHPKVQFNEMCLPLGAAVHAQVATEWLAANKVD